jgi:hypothetical protein
LSHILGPLTTFFKCYLQLRSTQAAKVLWLWF